MVVFRFSKGRATFITLLLVAVIYSIFVLDLKIIQWETAATPNTNPATIVPTR
jgi:hypothetical protein